MIRSMTGFGRSTQSVDAREITVEIKSVNHRYFEFNCRTSRGYNFLEEKLKSYISQRVSRGKIDVYVSVISNREADAVISVNHNMVAGYLNAFEEISDKYKIENDATVSSISKFSDIYTVRKAIEDEEEVLKEVLPVVDDAVNKFIDMREIEGNKMKEDVQNRSKTILSIVAEIERYSPQIVEEHRIKLEERIKEMISSVNIDEQRILTESAIFADKTAVAEETVRLRSHFEQLDNLLNSKEAVGRKIDFLLQEMNRETNTIGSKVQNAKLAHKVVDIKAELEKIREQIQNIE